MKKSDIRAQILVDVAEEGNLYDLEIRDITYDIRDIIGNVHGKALHRQNGFTDFESAREAAVAWIDINCTE